MELKETIFNLTTPHISTPNPKPRFSGFYALLVVLLALLGCVVSVVVYMKRRSRLDKLRHRLIPVYTYDPSEEPEWEEDVDEEVELAAPLYKESTLSFSSAYGTNWK